MEQPATPLTSDDIRSLVRPDHVHRRAYADAAVFQLELPGAVGRRVLALEVGERERVAGTQVRHAPGVPVDLGVHSASSLWLG